MPLSTRGIPRFLPTLTEIVHAPPAPEPLLDNVLSEQIDPQTIIDQVQLPIQAAVEDRVRQIVASALAAQVEQMTAHLMGELEPALRQIVQEAVAREVAITRRN